MSYLRPLSVCVGAALSLVGSLAAGCGGELEITDEPLVGVIDNEPYTFKVGYTNEFLSEGQPDFFTKLLNETFGACSSTNPVNPHILLGLPKEEGSYSLGLDHTVTFVKGSDNLVATEGKLRIDKITATRVTGGVHAKYDDNNEIDGTFEVTICAGPAAE